MSDLHRKEAKYPNQKLDLTLGIPPSVNHMYHNLPNGGRTLNERGKEFIRINRAKILAEIADEMYEEEHFQVWQYLDIVVYMPDKRRRDSHNMLKLLLDMIEGVAYDDDYYIMPRINAVELDRENPRLEVALYPQTEKERSRYVN